jgi:hypothetical protein
MSSFPCEEKFVHRRSRLAVRVKKTAGLGLTDFSPASFSPGIEPARTV